MNIRELKEAIENLPDDMEVIIQKDSEGNDYSPLRGADPDAIYVPECGWSGTAYSTKYSAKDHCMSDKEWNDMLSKPRSLILYPIN